MKDDTVMEALTKARDALRAHAKWHEEWDEYGGYPDSSLDEKTTEALGLISQAVELVDDVGVDHIRYFVYGIGVGAMMAMTLVAMAAVFL